MISSLIMLWRNVYHLYKTCARSSSHCRRSWMSCRCADSRHGSVL